MKKVVFLCLALLVISATSAKAVNSYELFWPMVSGRTEADGLSYKLKTFKEGIREYLIFGPAPKANYKVFLGVKRILEAEKLLSENKKALSLSTFDRAINEFEAAQSAVTLDSKDRLEKVTILVKDLDNKYSTDSEINLKLEKVMSQTNALLSKFAQ